MLPTFGIELAADEPSLGFQPLHCPVAIHPNELIDGLEKSRVRLPRHRTSAHLCGVALGVGERGADPVFKQGLVQAKELADARQHHAGVAAKCIRRDDAKRCRGKFLVPQFQLKIVQRDRKERIVCFHHVAVFPQQGASRCLLVHLGTLVKLRDCSCYMLAEGTLGQPNSPMADVLGAVPIG